METIWHVTPGGEPAAPGPEGFVHASFTDQLAETLRVHYPDAARVVLLRLDPEALGARLVVEPSRGGQPFPHVYGSVLPGDVTGRVTVVRDAEGRFDLSALDEPGSLALLPRPVTRPWGGRKVGPRFGWAEPAGDPTGEWWLASCYPDHVSPLVGRQDDLAAWLDGPGRSRGCPPPGEFPLLVKFLDCAQILSLQVHPDDAVAVRQGLPNGKTEAWHVLEADPGAAVWLGTAEGTDGASLLDALAGDPTDEQVLSLLHKIELRAGDTLLVEAGTVHAIGGGLLLYEIQQTSDATWRLYDWGRGRELHLERAREAVVDRRPPAPVRREPTDDAWTTLVPTGPFSLRRARVADGLRVAPAGAFGLLTVLDGEGHLEHGGPPLRAGDTRLLLEPATVRGAGLDLLLAEPAAG